MSENSNVAEYNPETVSNVYRKSWVAYIRFMFLFFILASIGLIFFKTKILVGVI